MSRIKLTFTLLLTFLVAGSAFLPQAVSAAATSKLSFVKIFGGAASEAAYAVAANSSYFATVGYSYSTSVDLDRDNVVAGDTHSASSAFGDVVIAVYNTSGVYQWGKLLGAGSTDLGYSITIDASSNVYVSGYFGSTVDFDEDNVVSNDTVTSAGNLDCFVAKYNSTGVLQWVKAIGGTNYDVAQDVKVDGSGNVYATGYFAGASVDFDRNNVVGGDTISSNGNEDSFVVKYNSSGTLQWVERIGGTSDDVGSALNIDSSGSVLAAGYFSSSNVDFEEGSVVAGDTHSDAASPTAFGDMYIAKYNSSGTLQWVNTPQDGDVFTVTSDASNNVYIGGTFASANTDFDENNVVAGDTVSATDIGGLYGDSYIGKYNSSGTLVWLKAFGNTNRDEVLGLDVVGTKLLVAGRTGAVSVDFDRANSVAGDTHYNTNADFLEGFVAKYDTGTAIIDWVKVYGSTGQDMSLGLDATDADTIYVAGTTNSTSVDFDRENSVTGDTKSPSGYDGFVAKYVAPANDAIPIYRFWSDQFNGHFYTISSGEKGYVQVTYPSVWTYEGPVYYAYAANDCGSGRSSVYRFWSDQLASHFYTISTTERDFVLANYASVWTYEGVAFCAYTTNVAGTSAVHRFWSDTFQNHFYTISTAEKDYVIANYSSVWTYEGVVYYAVP